ncbi:MAG: DUF4350 domain-containing protein [Halalkalicoccus sp.]
MDRRRFLATAGAALGTNALPSAVAGSPAGADLRQVRFYSPASQIPAPDRGRTAAVVRAEPTAESAAATRGDAHDHDGPIPLVSVDGRVAAFGSMLVPSAGQLSASENVAYANDRLVLGIWDAILGSGTVRWDGSHEQYWDLGKFERFADRAREHGYTVRGSDDLLADLDGADGLVITTPPAMFSPTELDALAAFVEGGGALFVHDQADFRGLDETDNLNAIAERLDLSFRFNADEVTDDEHNAGAPFDVLTTDYDPDLLA